MDKGRVYIPQLNTSQCIPGRLECCQSLQRCSAKQSQMNKTANIFLEAPCLFASCALVGCGVGCEYPPVNSSIHTVHRALRCVSDAHLLHNIKAVSGLLPSMSNWFVLPPISLFSAGTKGSTGVVWRWMRGASFAIHHSMPEVVHS